LSDDQIRDLLVNSSLGDFAQEYYAEIDKIPKEEFLKTKSTKINERASYIQNASNLVESKILSGDLTSENALKDTDFVSLVNGAEELAKLYPDLITDAKILSNENLIGTESWMSALHKVQD
jgi:hypothetical protein